MPLSPTPTPSLVITPEAFPTTAPTNTPTPYTFGSFKAGDPTATPLGSDITDLNFIEGVKIYDEGIKTNDKKNFEKVIPLMNAVIEINSNLAPPYRYRGTSYWYLGRCGEALADFDHALSINPNYAAAWAGRGLANDCLGNKTQMLLDYQKALAIDPSLAFVHHIYGVYYLGQGDYEKSLEEYTISVSIDPNRAGAWSGKAEALFKLGRYEECIVNASKAIETDPKEWLAYSDIAFCEDFTENYAAAVEDFKVFVVHYDANAETWYNLGISQRKTNDLEGALTSYTKALEIDPSYYVANINRGNAYVLLKKYKTALADFNRALGFGDIPPAYAGRGDAYHGLKE
jgi:tetratricopeptide (TPR) repeat protein